MLMNCTIPGGSYAGWGWGSSMTDTEMVIFSADATTPTVGTYYSTGETPPGADAKYESCYTTKINDLGNGFIEFITTRPLDCNIADSYVVALDTELELITAWNPTNPVLSFHSGNYLEFTQLFASDGSCTLVEAAGHNLQYYIHGVFMWTAWALIGLL